MEPITDWAGVDAAMAKVATAHNAMKRRVVALAKEVERLSEQIASATASTDPGTLAALSEAGVQVDTTAPWVGQTGVFVPVAHCLVCGGEKAPGRENTLTCHTCGMIRHKIITTRGADRSPILTDSCANCGKPKATSTKMLCNPCSGAFKAWKDTLQ